MPHDTTDQRRLNPRNTTLEIHTQDTHRKRCSGTHETTCTHGRPARTAIRQGQNCIIKEWREWVQDNHECVCTITRAVHADLSYHARFRFNQYTDALSRCYSMIAAPPRFPAWTAAIACMDASYTSMKETRVQILVATHEFNIDPNMRVCSINQRPSTVWMMMP